jgi:rare lipoprotein A (peptidoglycan hydrolase)
MQLIRKSMLPLMAIAGVMVVMGLLSTAAQGTTTTSSTTTTVKATTTTVKATTTTSSTTTTVKATTTTTVKATTTTTVKPALPPRTLVGLATYYRPPAKGVYFGPTIVCASIKAIPMKTKVTITNLGNGKTSTCMVGDRKAESTVRIIDLNDTVFASLAPLSQGVLRVKLTW